MPSTTKYFISTLIFLAASGAWGQEKKKEKEKVKTSFSPTGIRVGTDLIDLTKNFAGKTFKGWEVNGDIDFSKYYLVADVGSWAKTLPLSNGTYNNGGGYFRLGVDVNLLGNDPDKNMFFLGFRVAHAGFHESVTYQATSTQLFAPNPVNLTNSHVTGGWGELTSGLRVKVWKGFWMGYTARLKLAPGAKGGGGALVPYDMPGYGLIQKDPWWGFNYQVFWRIAWKKDQVPPKK